MFWCHTSKDLPVPDALQLSMDSEMGVVNLREEALSPYLNLIAEGISARLYI